MAALTIRTSVSFDPSTVSRWERLAKYWGVSKSEALRRALETAENHASSSAEPDFQSMSPVAVLDWLRDDSMPPVPGGWGNDPHAELRALRVRDAEIEEEREHSRATRKPSKSTP